MNCLIAIIGPTGIGKSELALNLAQTFDGEIVSADSRQIYRHMDIGTAKPSREELSLVPHYLIDVVNPDEGFSLAQYQEMAYLAIEDIQKRGKLALLVGGSGQYVWSVLEGWEIPQVPPNLEFRNRLQMMAAKGGGEDLYNELMKIDSIAAQNIDRRNIRRVIRALEVYESTEIPFSRLQHKSAPTFQAFTIGLTADRAELYRRIDLRVDKMIKGGLVAEVENLVNMGYDFIIPAMSGIGYKQIGMYLGGELSLEAAVQQIKYETHRIARHQCAWFQLKDKRIQWFDIQRQEKSEIEERVAEFVGDEDR